MKTQKEHYLGFLIKSYTHSAQLHDENLRPFKIFDDVFQARNYVTEKLLNDLYILTEKETKETLSKEDKTKYIDIVSCLQSENINIPFGIEI